MENQTSKGATEIKVREVNFTYPNGIRALRDVSFCVTSGEGKIIGLLGPNGAGKTTLVNILSTVFKKFTGEAYVCGLSVRKNYQEIRKIISIAPQELIIDVLLTVYDNLFIHGLIDGIPLSLLRKRIPYLLEKIELWEERNRLALNLSGGQMRRLQIIRAILKREAKIFFIDEPTIGLDPRGKQVIWEELRALRREHKIIFLASNDMVEIERLCDEIIFIDKGKVLFKGSVDEAKKSFAPAKVIDVELEESIEKDKVEQLQTEFSKEVIQVVPTDENHNFQLWVNEEPKFLFLLMDWCKNQNLRIKKIRTKEGTLEEVFYSLVKKSENY